MSLNKRFTGDYKLESIDSGDRFSMDTAGGVTIDTTTDTPIIFVTALVTGIKYRIIYLGDTNFVDVGAIEFIAGTFEIGDEYVITAVDDGAGGAVTDFTNIGAPDNDIGTMFTATGAGTGTGTAVDTLFIASGTDAGTGTAKAAQGVTITGDLTVLGTSTSIKSTDTDIVDNTIVLNSGEIGPGVSAGVSGIEIDRGDGVTVGQEIAGIRFSESLSGWEVNNGLGTWTPIVIGSGFSLVTDLDPHLGGDLNVNGWDIVTETAVDINLLTGANGSMLLSTTTSGDITLSAADIVSITAVSGTLDLISGSNTTLTSGDTVVVIAQNLLSLNSAANDIILSTDVANIVLTANTGVGITATTSDVTLAATATAVTLTAGTDITLTAANDLVLTATAGLLKIEQEITLIEQTIPILGDGIALYNKLSAGVAGEGGTGLYFVNDTVTDELVSKKKAIAYSIIF